MNTSGFFKIVEKYIANHNIRFWCNQEDQQTLLGLSECFENLHEFENPDAYSIVNDTVCIFEHFEFNSTKETSKGSRSHIDLAKIDRRTKNKEGFFYDKVNAPQTAEHYITNALRHFQTHCNKVEQYKYNLRNLGIIDDKSKVKTVFFIEDSTILGNVYEKEDGVRNLVLAHCKQFLDLFEKQDDVDACFCAGYNMHEYETWFINKNMIEKYRAQQIDIEQIDIVDFRPNVITTNSIVRKD